MSSSTAELVAAHMQAAREDLAAAHTDLNAGHLRACVNRAYYAVFHAGSALLATRGVIARRHHGVWTNLDKEFLLQDRMTKADSAAYHELYAARVEADYKAPASLPEELVRDLLAKAQQFVAHAETLLEEDGYGTDGEPAPK